MSYMKLSSFFILLLPSLVLAQKFSSKECLDAKYKTEIKSEGKFFGLIKNNLNIEKEACLITVRFKGILETVWKVDICREPIHMKVSSKGSQNVHKRLKKCEEDSNDDFCYYLKELKTNLSDYGLIFAEGLREKLSDAHGQAFCTSLLIDRYFEDGYVFSSFDKPIDIYKSQESCAIPEKESETTTTSTPTEPEPAMSLQKMQDEASQEEKRKF